MLRKVISGGQTGVDRAALDAALEVGIPIGGWCPLGRRAEDGTIPDRYTLTETESADYLVRTKRNVRDSDATLVLYVEVTDGGTAQTLYAAERLKKPVLAIDLAGADMGASIATWIRECGVQTLNVAGPRESKCHGVYSDAFRLLQRVFASII